MGASEKATKPWEGFQFTAALHFALSHPIRVCYLESKVDSGLKKVLSHLSQLGM